MPIQLNSLENVAFFCFNSISVFTVYLNTASGTTKCNIRFLLLIILFIIWLQVIQTKVCDIMFNEEYESGFILPHASSEENTDRKECVHKSVPFHIRAPTYRVERHLTNESHKWFIPMNWIQFLAPVFFSSFIQVSG